MKRFACAALLASMLFGAAWSASAAELKTRGSIDVYGQWSQNLYDFNSDNPDADNHSINQRVRMYFDYVASQNLKGVVGFEIDTDWGFDAGFGTDQSNRGSSTSTTGAVEVKHAYIDFTYPDTTVNIKAGLQPVALPGVFGSPIFDDDAPAFVVSAPINDMFALTAGFMRDQDTNTDNIVSTAKDQELDASFLAAPIKLDGFAITPYFAYGWVGEDRETAEAYNIWWLGANAELTMFDPLTFAADLMYGSTSGLDENDKGWYGALAASYKFDMVTPTLFFTYASGDDDDAGDGSEIMPQLSEGWAISPMTGARAFNTTWDTWGLTGLPQEAGLAMWTAGLKLDKIQFIDNLTHTLVVAYLKGTSDEDSAQLFDEESHAFEVYLANTYKIYENLSAIVEFDYFAPDFNDDKFDDADPSAFVAAGFKYKF
ncbi:MAG: outer membrane homotrimeric porin [Desulfomicrobiaceae bacterium]|nr:outer membrane homotrimeric porin [Desulfomicrobiaceae bacterium]